MRGSALRLVLLVFAAFVVLWLLGALVQGVLVSLSLTTRRFFLFYWWFQRFGLGVVIGFVLGLVAGWLLTQRGREETARSAARGESDDLNEAERQLAALKDELAAEDERPT